jgi:predicted Zn-dependent peptidase
MMRFALLMVAILTLAACTSEDKSTEGENTQENQTQENRAQETMPDSPVASVETSPGGIVYTLISLPDQDDVTIQVAWPSDWAYRPATNKAAPWVGPELMLAGGAEEYPAGEVSERLADLNAEGALYVAGNDHVMGELTVDGEHMPELVEIANAHLRAPTLDQHWFNRIRDGYAQNLAEARLQPSAAGFDAVRWAVFSEHPLRNALALDQPGTFESFTVNDIAAWRAETFTRHPSAIVVAGGIDTAAAGEALDTLFAGLPEKSSDASPDESEAGFVPNLTPDFSPRRILLHLPDAEVSSLAFIAPLPPTRLGGEMEDLLLILALGSDDQSVLFKAVRDELRASYGFGAGIDNYTREQRILVMAGEVDTESVADAERRVREAYASFRQTGLKGDLADRKASLEAGFSKLGDFVIDQARTEIQSTLDGFEPGQSLTLIEELAAVTEQSVMERLNDAFPAHDDFIVMAVSPDADALPGACVISAPREAAGCP